MIRKLNLLESVKGGEMSRIEELQDVSIKELLKFFNGPQAIRESKDAKLGAALAVKSLAAVGRVKATDRAQDGMKLTILKSISGDKKQFQEYVKVSLPHLSPSKQISHEKTK